MTLYKKAWFLSSLIVVYSLLTVIVGEHLAHTYGFTVWFAVALLCLAPAVLPFLF